jgi:hypothetical protein
MEKNPKIAIVPDGKYASFEAGQRLIIESFNGDSFAVKDPRTGQILFCLVSGCAHLSGREWILE